MPPQREREQQDKKRGSARDWADSVGNSWVPTDLNIPKGLEIFKLKEGPAMVFDLMPYLAGEGNPRADAGFEHWERTYYLHTIPNAAGKWDKFCCLWNNACWKEVCPACQYVSSMSDKELADKMRSKQRHLFLVNERPGSKPSERNPLRLMNAVHFNRKNGFGEKLKERINNYNWSADTINPADRDNGVTLRVSVAEEKFQSVGLIDFIEREYAYPESVLQHGYCLDDMILKPDPDALREALGMAGESEAVAPKKTSSSRPPSDDVAPPKASRNGSAKAPVQDEPDEDEGDEDAAPPKKTPMSKPGKKAIAQDDEDAAPSKPTGKVAKAKAPVVEPDDEESLDDDEDADIPFDDADDDLPEEDEEPAPPPKKGPGRPKKK